MRAVRVGIRQRWIPPDKRPEKRTRVRPAQPKPSHSQLLGQTPAKEEQQPRQRNQQRHSLGDSDTQAGRLLDVNSGHSDKKLEKEPEPQPLDAQSGSVRTMENTARRHCQGYSQTFCQEHCQGHSQRNGHTVRYAQSKYRGRWALALATRLGVSLTSWEFLYAKGLPTALCCPPPTPDCSPPLRLLVLMVIGTGTFYSCGPDPFPCQ